MEKKTHSICRIHHLDLRSVFHLHRIALGDVLKRLASGNLKYQKLGLSIAIEITIYNR